MEREQFENVVNSAFEIAFSKIDLVRSDTHSAVTLGG
jgi:hypothetical protein